MTKQEVFDRMTELTIDLDTARRTVGDLRGTVELFEYGQSKLRKENEELRKGNEIAKTVVDAQHRRIVELENIIEDMEIDIADMNEWAEYTRENFRICKNSEEIYKENFSTCVKKLHEVQDDNDKLRLLLSKYFQRYGEIK
jgi:regulator of replication initiation timing